MELEKLKFIANIDQSSFEVLNSEFTKAKAYILYYGDNKNKSRLSKETVEAAMPSLFNTPVVAEFVEKKEDFGTHGGKIIISDEGIEFVQTTRPYGLVPESANPRWEMVEDKEYLVADIILWSGRYAELEKTVEEFSNQSMEINVMEGSWLKEEETYDITKFEFSALCLLGQSVEPCFEQAKVVAYGLDEFKQETDEMFKKYKEFVAVDETEQEEEVPETQIESTEEFSAEETDTEELPILVFTQEEYESLMAERNQFATEVEQLNSKIAEFEATIATISADNETLKSENIQLTEYKNKNEYEIAKFDIESLIEEFEPTLAENDEFKALQGEFAQSFEKGEIFMGLDDLEKELFAMVGRMKHKLNTKKQKKQNFSRVVVTEELDETNPGYFGSAEKYIKKLNKN